MPQVRVAFELWPSSRKLCSCNCVFCVCVCVSWQTHNSYFHSAFIDFSVSAVGSRVVESRSRNIFTICNRRSSLLLPPKALLMRLSAASLYYTNTERDGKREKEREIDRYSYYMYAAEFCLWFQSTTNVLMHKQRALSRQKGERGGRRKGRKRRESVGH